MVGVSGARGGCSTVGVGGGVGVGVIGEGRAGEELRRAASLGQVSTVLALIDQGVGVNLTDECGRSALHWACAKKCQDVVAALIISGAKCNLADTCGYTGLQRAACEGHDKIVQQLIKSNANVDHQDDQHGNTALHEAAWKGYSHTAEALVRAKANVYMKNKGGFAPLHLACQNGHNQTCRVLLLAGCKPDIKNNYGDTPLHTAARYGHAGVTRILLSARANVTEVNKNGDTALHIAAAMGRRKLTKILLEAAADQSLRNKQSETPEDIAKRKEFQQILEILQNPPPIVTPEERLRQEQEQRRKEEKGKAKAHKDKKRDKTNDSGTSSRDSLTKPKDKKKHKSDKSKSMGWSPYGCHYYPPDKEFPRPNIDSLPKDPLCNGEQYFIDLAGNIKKGPIGVGYTCYCAPFFKNVETKLEKDKVDLMDHIDAAHDKLDARISSLEHKTKSHILNLNDTVVRKLAAEKEECRARIDRSRTVKDKETDSKVEQLHTWVEHRLASHEFPNMPTLKGRTFTSRNGTISRKSRDPITGLFPLSRSRSEEAISEYQGDEDTVYKGLRVLDHPTSMYNIHKCFDDVDDSVIYDSPKKNPTAVFRNDGIPQPSHRSRSAEGSRLSDTNHHSDSQKGSGQDSSIATDKHPFDESTGSDTESGRNTVRGPFSVNGYNSREGSYFKHMNGGVKSTTNTTYPLGNGNRVSPDVRKKSKDNPRPLPYIGDSEDLLTPRSTMQPDLNEAVDNLTVSHNGDNSASKPKTNDYLNNSALYSDDYMLNKSSNSTNDYTTQEWSSYSRYDYRNTNPYMYDLRNKSSGGVRTPYTEPNTQSCIPEGIEELQHSQYPNPTANGTVSTAYDVLVDYDGSSYLDMDSRYKIQQAVKKLYDGYLADGKLEIGRGSRALLESSTDHDSHNDSGYSTRLCTGSQGPSPALSGVHDGSETDGKVHHQQPKIHAHPKFISEESVKCHNETSKYLLQSNHTKYELDNLTDSHKYYQSNPNNYPPPIHGHTKTPPVNPSTRYTITDQSSYPTHLYQRYSSDDIRPRNPSYDHYGVVHRIDQQHQVNPHIYDSHNSNKVEDSTNYSPHSRGLAKPNHNSHSQHEKVGESSLV